MADITNIRVTEKSYAFLNKLKDEQQLFNEDREAAMFGAAYAIAKGLDVGIDEIPPLEGNTFNKWDSRSLDEDGLFTILILSRHPSCEEPYRMIQFLVNRGLETMADLSRDGAPIELSNFM